MSQEPAVGYLAGRTRRGRRSDPGLAPSSLRRRAAALKGFYRFAYGEGLIRFDVAAHLDLPRPQRLLPETLTVDEVDRLLEAVPGDTTASLRDRGAARAPVRRRSPDQRGDRSRPRGPVGRWSVRPRHRKGRQGTTRARRRRGARLARPLDGRSASDSPRDRACPATERRTALPRRSWPTARAAAGLGRGQACRRGREARRKG